MSKKLVIILSGRRGKLGGAVAEYLEEIGQDFLLFDDIQDDFKKKDDEFYVILYASSADKFIDVLEFSLDQNIALVNGCTDIKFKKNLSGGLFSCNNKDRSVSFKAQSVVINAQNWDLSMVGWMAAMKKYGKLIAYGYENTFIHESHQASKKSIPGTAKVFAEGLGIEEFDIISERGPVSQRLNWKIDPEYLNGHACHKVDIKYENSLKKTGFYTSIMGRKDYAIGGLNIAKIVMENFDNIPNGVSSIEDFVDLGFFE